MSKVSVVIRAVQWADKSLTRPSHVSAATRQGDCGSSRRLSSSPGLQPRTSQMAVRVVKRTARAWPFFRIDSFGLLHDP